MKTGMVHTFTTTAAAIAPFLIVAGTVGDKILAATAATDKLIGTTDSLGAEASSPTGIDLTGIGQVKLGGDVPFGAMITSDGASLGIECTPSNSTNKRYIGFALQGGVTGDVIDYKIAPGIMGKPSA
jgi:hypothetical protein